MNKNTQYIKDTFQWALRNQLVKNQRDFADKVGINRASLSLFLRGNEQVSGKNSARKVKAWMDSNFGGQMGLNVEDYKKGYEDALRDRDDFDWEAFRRQATLDIFCAVVNRPFSISRNGLEVNSHSDLIDIAIVDANEIIEKLKDGKK